MDSTPTQQVARPDLAREAEGLLRCLAGVKHARVVAGDRGIDAIHILAASRAVVPGLAGKVRSALLAGLATPILPARIHIRVDNDADIVEDRDASRQAPRGNSAGDAPTVDGVDSDGTAEPHPIALPRLVAVDLDRHDDGRIRCRVSVAFRTQVHSDEALAVDLPGAPAHAAAQAAVRALVQAGIHGLELDGLREVEIAGQEYALVALRRTDTPGRLQSGSAPIGRSAERAAALATVTAAKELL